MGFRKVILNMLRGIAKFPLPDKEWFGTVLFEKMPVKLNSLVYKGIRNFLYEAANREN